MLDIKYGANLAIPGGPQFSLSNQVLKCEVYKDYSITLDATQQTTAQDEITISKSDSEFLNLLVIKATSALAKDSKSKLKYSIEIEEVSPSTGTGAGAATSTVTWLDLDAPLFIFGTWVNSILPKDKDKKILFKLEGDTSKPEFKKDTFQIEVLIGWSEAT